jgi:ubiquitin
MGKKRKKKVYNTPKKIKHVNSNTKLNILNSINNLKCNTCNNSMAKHFDRYTCSFCNISVKNLI